MVDAMVKLNCSCQKSPAAGRRAAWSACFVGVMLAAGDARADRRSARATAPAIVAEFSVGREGEALIIPIVVRWRETSPGSAPEKKICRMWLDTGAATTLFHKSHRAELGAPLGKIAAKGSTRSFDAEAFNTPTLEIGGETMRPSGSVLCVDMRSQIERLGEHIDGVIGMDVLGDLALSIDFDLGKVRFHRAVGRSVEPAVPIALDTWRRPHVSAQLPDGTSEWFLIDTGEIGLSAGRLGTAPSQRLVESGHLLPLSPRFVGSVLGLDGISVGEMRRATRFSIARYTHQNLVFGRIGENSLGLGYLSRYNVTFDFAKRVMYLRPSKRFAAADRVALSGLELFRSTAAMRVADVSPDRPAAAAHLLAGDVITEVDGKKTQSLTVFATERLLSLPGRHVLVIARGAVQERVVLAVGEAKPKGVDEPADVRFKFDGRKRFAVVPVSANGLSRTFILATSSTMTLFDTVFRDALGKPLRTLEGETPDGRAMFELFSPPRANVGPLALGELAAVCCQDLSRSRICDGIQLFGLLGTDFLRSRIVRVDFDRGEIAFLRDLPKGAGARVDLQNARGRPAAIVAVRGAGRLPFVIDSVCEHTGYLSAALVAELLNGGGAAHVATLRRESTLMTAKTVSVPVVRVAEIEVGGFTHRDLMLSEENENALGLGFLSRYVVTFDFPGMAMYLKPGERFDEPDRRDLSGAALWCPNDSITVRFVDEYSAAEAAGLRAGDIIEEVDGQAANSLALAQVRETLRVAGKHTLCVTRGTERIEIVLVLYDAPTPSRDR
jgi:membrane-associated protease RseP (regulator of RpoE activity)